MDKNKRPGETDSHIKTAGVLVGKILFCGRALFFSALTRVPILNCTLRDTLIFVIVINQ